MAAEQGFMLTKQAVQRSAKTARRVLGRIGDDEGPDFGQGEAGGHWAKITDVLQDGDNYRWAYASDEVHKATAGFGGWDTVDNGLSTTTDGAPDSDDEGAPDTPIAYNTLEEMNTDGGLTGCGVNVDNLPDGYDLGSVPIGAVAWMEPVWCDDGTIEYQFTAINQVTGACTDGGG